MNSAHIMHEVFILVADFFIIWSIIKLHNKNKLLSKKLYQRILFIGAILAILSLASIQYINTLSPHHALAFVLGIIVLSNGLIGLNINPRFIKKRRIQFIASKMTVVFAVISMALGALALSKHYFS